MTIIVTGGAGFIGTNFVIDWSARSNESIVVVDCLTDVANVQSLNLAATNSRHFFERGDIADRQFIDSVLRRYRPRIVLNFAAESHVDRSIRNPERFVQTNVIGTFTLLEACRHYWVNLNSIKAAKFRFLHVSTDEVYGSLSESALPFTEEDRFKPNSPYAATKAASDHLLRAWFQTYGFPALTTNCSNNYGPYQFPEKLIPLVIHNALAGKDIPIYGDGLHTRDWLYVEDHCRAINAVLENGRPGETYNIGGNGERTNLEVIQSICSILDAKRPRSDCRSYAELKSFVTDRPGHDRRYAIDFSKIRKELNWSPVETFESGIFKTVNWYLSHAV